MIKSQYLIHKHSPTLIHWLQDKEMQCLNTRPTHPTNNPTNKLNIDIVRFCETLDYVQ